MLKESVAIAGVCEFQVENLGIIHSLLNTSPQGVIVILCLYNGKGLALMIKEIISLLARSHRMMTACHMNTSVGEIILFTHISWYHPTFGIKGR